jgi:hypothetical protein
MHYDIFKLLAYPFQLAVLTLHRTDVSDVGDLSNYSLTYIVETKVLKTANWPCLIHHISNLATYEAIILPVVLYECKTWSLILREEQRQRVFENRVLRSIFGPRMDEVTGGELEKSVYQGAS